MKFRAFIIFSFVCLHDLSGLNFFISIYFNCFQYSIYIFFTKTTHEAVYYSRAKNKNYFQRHLHTAGNYK